MTAPAAASAPSTPGHPRRFAASFALAALVLHWSWEVGHGVAYVETNVPLVQRLWHCFPMAVVDMAWSGAIVALALLVVRATRHRVLGWTIAVAGGAVSAVIVERLAIDAGRWTYNTLMPLIPLVGAGLWPVLQMIVLPPLAYALARREELRPQVR